MLVCKTTYRIQHVVRHVVWMQCHDIVIHRLGLVISPQTHIAELSLAHHAGRNVRDTDGGAHQIVPGGLGEAAYSVLGSAVGGSG